MLETVFIVMVIELGLVLILIIAAALAGPPECPLCWARREEQRRIEAARLEFARGTPPIPTSQRQEFEAVKRLTNCRHEGRLS